jgi:hypothetical protein
MDASEDHRLDIGESNSDCAYTQYLGSQSPNGKTRQKGKEERQERKEERGRQGRKEGRKEVRKPVLGGRNDWI